MSRLGYIFRRLDVGGVFFVLIVTMTVVIVGLVIRQTIIEHHPPDEVYQVIDGHLGYPQSFRVNNWFEFAKHAYCVEVTYVTYDLSNYAEYTWFMVRRNYQDKPVVTGNTKESNEACLILREHFRHGL